jgi:hypothetical protein
VSPRMPKVRTPGAVRTPKAKSTRPRDDEAQDYFSIPVEQASPSPPASR